MEHNVADKRDSTDKQPSAGTPRVEVDYFDPEGVLELRKVLSRQSQSQSQEPKKADLSRATTRTATDATLNDQSGNFDFEKTLRSKLSEYVHWLIVCGAKGS